MKLTRESLPYSLITGAILPRLGGRRYSVRTMNLYLMRHGIAAAKEDASVKHDGERPLTDKGIKRMRKAAKGVSRLGIAFDCVLTSPLLRARQTAEIVCRTLGIEDRLEEISALAPESTVEHLLFGLTRYQDREHLLLVGHEPLLSGFTVYLLGGQKPVNLKLDFKKGCLCRIETELSAGNPATLHWLLTPKQLRSLD
jgi:phosphohistidine phosphatase